MAIHSIVPLWLKILFAIILIALVACFAVYIIAVAKNMTFIEYIESWFQTASETIEPTVGQPISGTITGSTF